MTHEEAKVWLAETAIAALGFRRTCVEFSRRRSMAFACYQRGSEQVLVYDDGTLTVGLGNVGRMHEMTLAAAVIALAPQCHREATDIAPVGF